jgi:hypothetical protein
MAGAQKQVAKEREEEEEEGTEEEEVEEKEAGQKVSLPRAVWSGSLSIGLVNIPVKMIPLIRDKRVKLRMIHQKCNTPIHYKKTCEEGEEVPNDEIVHGYQIKKDRYVMKSWRRHSPNPATIFTWTGL